MLELALWEVAASFNLDINVIKWDWSYETFRNATAYIERKNDMEVIVSVYTEEVQTNETKTR